MLSELIGLHQLTKMYLDGVAVRAAGQDDFIHGDTALFLCEFNNLE